MSRVLVHIDNTVYRARATMESAGLPFKRSTLNKPVRRDSSSKLVDVSIQFIGASDLPKMDIIGWADPYFIATIDNEVTFRSSVQPNTKQPVWNETWKVKNVPADAVLSVKILDKDEKSVHDDFMGKFKTPIQSGAQQFDIIGTLNMQPRGIFWLNITTKPSEYYARARRYIFDGPIRYSRHYSPTVGHLTNLNNERLYSTWKVYLKGVPEFFRDEFQHWNTKYSSALTIFGSGPRSLAVRSSIRSAHRMLYARSMRNAFGLLEIREDFSNLLRAGSGKGSAASIARHRIKPAIYTYAIAASDDSFRFSETGAAFFVDFASKHVLHASCSEFVRYSGEFHPRSLGGWQKFDDAISDDQVEWDLVVDNNSGTYGPDPMLLTDLKALLEYNFPGLAIQALDYNNPALTESREACREYASKYRGVRHAELQPTANEGEEMLRQHASARIISLDNPDERPPLNELKPSRSLMT